MNTFRLIKSLFLANLLLAGCKTPDSKETDTSGTIRYSGFLTSPVSVPLLIASDIPFSRTFFTLDGSEPVPTNPKAYSLPFENLKKPVVLDVKSTTVLRIQSYHEGNPISPETIRTWIFLKDVLKQKRPAKYPVFAETNCPWIYELNPDAVAAATPVAVMASLKSLPSLSLVVDPEHFFGESGIGTHPYLLGPPGTVPAHLEGLVFGTDLGKFDFNAPVELSISGIVGRFLKTTVKQSFRLTFSPHSVGHDLQADLFATGSKSSFKTILLSSPVEDSWAVGSELEEYWIKRWGWGAGSRAPHFEYNWNNLAHTATYIRNAFAAETQRDCGLNLPRRRFTHLYLNGLYWGVYEMVEGYEDSSLVPQRSDSSEKEVSNVFIINRKGALLGGESAEAAWGALFESTRRLLETEFRLREFWPMNGPPFDILTDAQRLKYEAQRSEQYAAVADQLDLAALADYFIINGYLNNVDSVPRWIAVRPSEAKGKFHFHVSDNEWTLRTGTWDDPRWGKSMLNFWAKFQGQFSGPGYLFGCLSPNPEFQTLFSSRLNFLLSPEGPLHPDIASARMSRVAKQFHVAMPAEFARWGGAYSHLAYQLSSPFEKIAPSDSPFKTTTAFELWKEAEALNESLRLGHHLAFGEIDASLAKTSGSDKGTPSVPAAYWNHLLPSIDQLARVIRPTSRPPASR